MISRRNIFLLAAMVLGTNSCYPVAGRAPVPDVIGEPYPSKYLENGARLLALPVWRRGSGYYLDDPLIVAVDELASAPASLDRQWYVGIKLFFHEYHGLYRHIRHLYLVSSTGQIFLLENHREWLMTHEACMGDRWRQQLIELFSSTREIRLLERNGDFEDFWGIASSERFTHNPEVCSELPAATTDLLQRLRIEICSDQRLFIPYRAATRRRVVEFLNRVHQCPTRAGGERWVEIQSLPLIPGY